MSKPALLINYEYCTGCHSCEIACRNEHGYGLGKWGIKMMEVPPFQIDEERWNWDDAPILTSLCDMCADRIANGGDAACAHVCLAQCIEYGDFLELAAKADAMAGKVYVISNQ